jgi:hypothetical protein
MERTLLATHPDDDLSREDVLAQSRAARPAIRKKFLGLGAIYAKIPRFLYAEQEAFALREFSESLGDTDLSAEVSDRLLCLRSPHAWINGGGYVNLRDELLAVLREEALSPVDLTRLWSLYCKVTYGLATRAFRFSLYERDRLLIALMAETISLLKQLDPTGLLLEDERGASGSALVYFLQRNTEALVRTTRMARLAEGRQRPAWFASAKEEAEVIQRLFVSLDRDPQGFYE